MLVKLLLVLLLLSSFSLKAQPLEEQEAVSCKKPPKGAARSIAALDNFHTWCNEGILKLANKIDYFFGGIRVDEESNETYARISFETRFRESEQMKFSTRQRVRLNLPGFEKKLKLIFDKEGLEEEEGDFIRPQDPNQENETGFDAALRYVVKRKAKWNTQLDGGLRVRRHRPFNVFARMRNRFTWEPRKWFIMRFVNELYYFVRTYGRADTRLDFDFTFKNKSLIRLGNFVRWEDRRDYYEFTNSISYFHELSERRAMSFNVAATGNDEVKTTYTNYAVFMQYRQLIYKDWLFVEVNPTLNFPKEYDFNPNLAVTLKLEFLIGNY